MGERMNTREQGQGRARNLPPPPWALVVWRPLGPSRNIGAPSEGPTPIGVGFFFNEFACSTMTINDTYRQKGSRDT